MPTIDTLDELIYTLLLVLALTILAAVERRLSGATGRRAAESLTVRILRQVLGEQFSERLHREGEVRLKDFFAALRVNFNASPIPLGLRVRAVLLLLMISYVASGGDVLRPETFLALFIAQAVRPTEWSASVGCRLTEDDEWRVKFLTVGAITLGAWSISELVVSDPDDRLFWLGWFALALVLGRVAWKGGPGHDSRRYSLAGWSFIGIGQFGSEHTPGPAGLTIAVLTCVAALYAAWGAYTEQITSDE